MFQLPKRLRGATFLLRISVAPFAKKGSVAQLYSALDFGSSGCGLESLRGHKRNPFHVNETGFFIEAYVKSALLKECEMKKRVICEAKDGFYACSRAMREVHVIIPPGSQNKAKSPIPYRFGASFIAKPQAENMKEF